MNHFILLPIALGSYDLYIMACRLVVAPVAGTARQKDLVRHDDAGDGIAAARDGMSRTITGAEARSRTRTTGRINRNTWSTCQKS